ncbi:probable WRKY transcription factor 2 [Medicago truncatula]|uniref:probable WRKY transcription factor 2 n=1 Tax=Medicago truncatula TaxID=3880 RepID=UPI00196752BF|nr:probable WRKY transcription factor 2 [Medicago truncatula]
MLVQDQQLLDFSFPEDFPNDYLASDESILLENSIHSKDIGQHHVLEAEQKEISHAAGAKTLQDGYNWRKYGQKQVKGSEYPRSYYKCNQSNCQVRKKVERSHDGNIREIIYSGNHNHAKPNSSRRGSVPSSDEMSENAEANETRGNIQSRGKDAKHNPEWKPDGQERTSQPSDVTGLSDPMKRARSQGMFESDDAQEHSSALDNHDGDKDGATPENNSDADSESKRRKKESYPVETMLPRRAVRAPRVIVQSESDIDVLDDGYRWRKYGQKVVKGNPNPRSYYKCTSAGCTVRKHVERASHNIKYVLTTYEGKHNHEVPAARNNNHSSSSANVLHRRAVIPSSETRRTLPSHFDRKPDFGNDFMRSSLMGSFSNDMKFGASSSSQMNYSSLNNIVPYGAYGAIPDHVAVPQTGPIASMFPEFQMPPPLNLPSSGNYSLAGINFNYEKPINSIQSYLSGQQLRDMDTRFLKGKQALNEDPPYAACAPSLDHASTSHTPPSPSQSIYQCVMQNFPS